MEAPNAALLPILGAQPGVLRVQLWQAAAMTAPPTREVALRGNVDRGADWCVTVEAAAAGDLEAVEARIREAVGSPSAVAMYQFLCGLDAPA